MFHNKRKNFIKSPCKFGKWQKKNCYTHSSPFNEFIREQAICGPWLIFEIKKTSSLFFKLWSKWKNRRENIFCKEYYIWDCTHNIFNFNKYFVCIIFLFVLLILKDLYEICVYNFLACPMGPIYLSSLSLEN